LWGGARAFGFEFELAGADRFMAPNKMPQDNQPNHQAQLSSLRFFGFYFPALFFVWETGVLWGGLWLPGQLVNQIVNARRVQ